MPLLLVAALFASPVQAAPAKPCAAKPPVAANTLTARERASGWKLLWDGKTSAGWRSATRPGFPAKGWSMCNGVLTIGAAGGEESRGGGDIITEKRYADFELGFDFLLTPGANSGLKIFAQTDIAPLDRVTGKPTPIGSGIGMEFQVLDDERHPDAKLGRDGNRTVGSFYDVMPAPKDKKVAPIGQWNHGRIVSRGGRMTFFLNGRQTIDVTRGSPEFAAAVAGSKFRNITGFGEWQDGHILLQDHGDTVSFTNLKIRELPAAK
jgi:hypothetical protein